MISSHDDDDDDDDEKKNESNSGTRMMETDVSNEDIMSNIKRQLIFKVNDEIKNMRHLDTNEGKRLYELMEKLMIENDYNREDAGRKIVELERKMHVESVKLEMESAKFRAQYGGRKYIFVSDMYGQGKVFKKSQDVCSIDMLLQFNALWNTKITKSTNSLKNQLSALLSLAKKCVVNSGEFIAYLQQFSKEGIGESRIKLCNSFNLHNKYAFKTGKIAIYTAYNVELNQYTEKNAITTLNDVVRYYTFVYGQGEYTVDVYQFMFEEDTFPAKVLYNSSSTAGHMVCILNKQKNTYRNAIKPDFNFINLSPQNYNTTLVCAKDDYSTNNDFSISKVIGFYKPKFRNMIINQNNLLDYHDINEKITQNPRQIIAEANDILTKLDKIQTFDYDVLKNIYTIMAVIHFIELHNLNLRLSSATHIVLEEHTVNDMISSFTNYLHDNFGENTGSSFAKNVRGVFSTRYLEM